MNDNEILKIVADNIRIERLKARLTQEQLAEMANISTKYMNGIENYKFNPTIIVVIKICSALKVNLNKIYPVNG